MTISPTIQRIRERRAAAYTEARAIADDAATENRALTGSEQPRFDRLTAEIDELDERLNAIRDGEQRVRDTEDTFGRLEQRAGHWRHRPAAEQELDGQFREAILSRSPAPIVVRDLHPRSGYQPGVEYRDLLTSAPASMFPVSFYGRVIEHMVEASSVLAAGATLITTESGEPLRVPRSTALSTAAIVTEAAAIPESDPTLSVVTLGAFKYGFMFQVSTELAQDAGFDLLGYLATQAGQAIGLGLGAHLVNGTGTGQPRGVITDATNGVTIAGTGATTSLGSQGTTGQGTDALNDLYGSIVEPYTRGPGVAWLGRTAELSNVRRLRAATSGELVGNLILEPATVRGSAASLMGKPFFVDAAVPAPAASAKALLFGDFSRYVVRMVNGVRFERSDDFAFANDLITFRALLRADGALVDTTGAVKYLTHTAT